MGIRIVAIAIIRAATIVVGFTRVVIDLMDGMFFCLGSSRALCKTAPCNEQPKRAWH